MSILNVIPAAADVDGGEVYNPCSVQIRMPERIAPAWQAPVGGGFGDEDGNAQNANLPERPLVCVTLSDKPGQNLARNAATRETAEAILKEYEQGGAIKKLETKLAGTKRFDVEFTESGSDITLDCTWRIDCGLTSVRLNTFRKLGHYQYTPQVDFYLAFYDQMGLNRASTRKIVTGTGKRFVQLVSANGQLMHGETDKAIGDVLQSVFDDAMEKMAIAIKKRYPNRSEITQVDGQTVSFLLGKENGVKAGDVYIVGVPGKQIRNPRNGHMVEFPPKAVATVQVITSVSEASTARILKIKSGLSAESLMGLEVFELVGNFTIVNGMCEEPKATKHSRNSRRRRH